MYIDEMDVFSTKDITKDRLDDLLDYVNERVKEFVLEGIFDYKRNSEDEFDSKSRLKDDYSKELEEIYLNAGVSKEKIGRYPYAKRIRKELIKYISVELEVSDLGVFEKEGIVFRLDINVDSTFLNSRVSAEFIEFRFGKLFKRENSYAAENLMFYMPSFFSHKKMDSLKIEFLKKLYILKDLSENMSKDELKGFLSLMESR
jgi:hypothetical protein